MSSFLRFGPFELDLEAAEVRSEGRRTRLPEQQFKILQMLLFANGGVVTREEIRKRLWPNDTVVEFDRSINAAIMKLRIALGDSADGPRVIETLARRGYRLLLLVENPIAATVEVPAALPSGSLVGMKISHYRVLDVLGGGGMGLVYRGEDLRLNRPVALKFLPDEMALDAVAARRFEREARTASALNHPNVCTIYQVEEHQGRPFIVMELLEGQTLRSFISKHASEPAPQRGIPLPQLFEIALRVCDGLDAAHRKGIVHRDIKPANIFLTSAGLCKILDFGLAKTTSGALADGIKDPFDSVSGIVEQDRAAEMMLSHAGSAQGTAGYMSPEQVRGDPVDERTDLFSFGLVLYEMATCERAFTGETATHVLDAVLRAPTPSARSCNPAIPDGLDQLIAKALEKDCARRWQTAAEMRAALADLSANRVASDSKAGFKSSTGRDRLRHSLSLRLALGIAFAIAVMAGVGLFARAGRPSLHISEYAQITHDGKSKAVNGTDGSRIYFTQQSPHFPAQISVAGGEVTPVKVNLAEAWLGALSPDHSTFLVISQSGGQQVANSLWAAEVLGDRLRHIADGVNSSTWSPDGATILYSTVTGDINIISTSGTEPHKIASPGGVIESLSWSPDGRMVRFAKDRSKIWEMAADGSNLRPMLPEDLNQAAQVSGAFMRDGRFIFVAGGELWIIDRALRFWPFAPPRPGQLTYGPIHWAYPVPSADGTKIFAVGATPHGELIRYNARNGDFNTFLGGISAEFLAFSPNGESIAYVSYPEGILWKANRDGSGRVQLTFPPVYPKLARWSPDGRQILFQDTTPQGHAGMYTVATDGSGTMQRLLSEEYDGITDPNWSPDGRSIIFCNSPEGLTNPRLDLRILDLARHTVSIVPGSAGLWGPRWSPDGKSIAAVTLDSTGLRVYDIAANQWRTVYTGSVAFPEWSHDSKSIYLLSWLKTPGIFRVPLPSGNSQRVADPSGTQYTGFYTSWMGLDPTDTPMLLRDTGTTDIYALTLRQF